MKNVTDSSTDTDHTIEDLLAAAGFDFTVVDRCPEPECQLCGEAKLPAAA